MIFHHCSFVFSVACLAILAACSSSPSRSGDSNAPAWAQQPSRTLDNGYIVYVASAVDHNAEVSNFKAESQALGDLVNECSFPPKGARIEDHYQAVSYGQTRTYAKIAVEYQLCEEAKNANDPQQIKALASTPFTEELKRYQDLVARESETEGQTGEQGNPALATTQNPSEPSSSSTQVRWVVRDEPQFWVVRQQIAVEKQVVILAPPNAYPPGAPQTTQLASQLSTGTQQVQSYAAVHPEIRKSTQTWSGKQRQWTAQKNARREQLKSNDWANRRLMATRGQSQSQEVYGKGGKGKRKRRGRGSDGGYYR